MKIRSSLVGAVIFCGLITAYIGSGYLAQEKEKADEAAQAKQLLERGNVVEKLTTVETLRLNSKKYTATISIPAQSETLNKVRVAAETGGIVLEKAVIKGQSVQKGDLLCRIDLGTRETELAQAQAGLIKAEIDYNSAVKLVKLGHAAKTTVTARKAGLDGATAAVKRAEKDIERVEIRSPINGVVETIPAKVGSLLSPGTECATISDATTMLIVGNISERDIGRISVGLNASISMITGDKFKGKLTYIAAAANASTRTFRVDVSVDNPNLLIRDGMTSQISIELEKTKAHFIKKSLLTLNESGDIGVRVVNKNNNVEFYKVKVLSDKKSGVWVSGLKDEINIISIGHEYVEAGQKVLIAVANSKDTSNVLGAK
ncbi:MAG: efflux RND transporter periplasmic adaptor subunit [Rhizobiales bacterium]|nr:efflux RND transporter periplasmic adaptor subunit [Hyphomicrobiales bacterium]